MESVGIYPKPSNNYVPSLESCKLSTEHMSKLAIKERDMWHYNFGNILNNPQSISRCVNNGEEDDIASEERHNIIKGVRITNKNCYYQRYHSDKGDWMNQFNENVTNNNFLVNTKRR